MSEPQAPEQKTPPAEPPRSRRETWFAAMVLSGMVFGMYVASAGPAVALSEKTGIGKKAMPVIYAPLAYLHKHTPLRAPLQWYVKMWEKMIG